MSKILITGATGLVGSACVSFFNTRGWDVVALDNNMRSQFFGTLPKEIENPTDIRDYQKLEEGFKTFGPFDAIIHAAAQPSHDYATEHVIEDFEVNARGTLNLLELTRKYCPKATFVYVSSDKVYGENMSVESYQYRAQGVTNLVELPTRYDFHIPFDEDLGLDFAGDRSFFGCSKAAADMYAQQYAARGMNVGIFRPGCITGKNHAGAEQHGFLAYLAKCIKEEQVYKIFGFKGKQVRDQIHANDLAAAFYEFIKKPKPLGIYNMGGGPERSVSVLEAMELIAKETGKTPKIEFHDARKGDRVWDVHDVSKFKSDYPKWNYQYSLTDIIKDLCV